MGKSIRRCCGIDVHKQSVTVGVLPPAGQPHLGVKKRKFRTFTRDLKQMRVWLKHCGVTQIAMESTGPYWRPLWNLLEGEFQKLLLVNPQHIQGLNGYKTDPKDAQWIADLLESGKLQGRGVPPRPIRELRDLTRQRVHLWEDLNRVKNRIEQLCQTCNIKVSSVATDLFGVSGRRLLEELGKGERDAGWMADYAKGKLRDKRGDLAWALDGTFTGEQRWRLHKELGQGKWLEEQVPALEEEIERRVAPFADARARLMTIPGIDRQTAWTIVAELGVDMTVFGDAHHLASWAGLCPGNRESGGKRFSGRVRKANRYVKRALCQSAWAPSHTKATYLAAFYRRMCVRQGSPKAILARAHHMIKVIYPVLSRNEKYVELGGDYYDQRNRPRMVAHLVKRLSRLGYVVELRETPPHIAGITSAQPTTESEPADEVPKAASTGRKRGRPCKCKERGIICTHGTSLVVNSMHSQQVEAGEFS